MLLEKEYNIHRIKYIIIISLILIIIISLITKKIYILILFIFTISTLYYSYKTFMEDNSKEEMIKYFIILYLHFINILFQIIILIL